MLIRQVVFRRFHFLLIGAVLVLNSLDVEAQKKVTVRGRIVSGEDFGELDLVELGLVLEQQVQFEPLPTPKDWDQQSQTERQKWLENFRESETGKAFFAKRKEAFDRRLIKKIELDEDGDFVLFDIPQGRYAIRGRVNEKLNGKLFAFEVFGQVDVGEVDEIQLGKIPVTATRLLEVGDSVPQMALPKLSDRSAEIRIDQLPKKFVLLHFWNPMSPPSQQDLLKLKKLEKSLTTLGLDLQFVGVSIGAKPNESLKLIQENKISWPQADAGNWLDETASAFGVRSVPYYLLLDKDRKVVVTNALFYQLLQTGKKEFQTIISEACSGKDMSAEWEKLRPKMDESGNASSKSKKEASLD